MIKYFNHTDPIVSNKLLVRNICRIATFGVCSLDNNAPVSLLFPLQDISDVHFYYGLPAQTIEDDGKGIPKNKREKVFKAFYRIDESRQSESANTGLGLTIAKDIIQGHGGRIILSGSNLGGLKVEIILPIKT